MKRGFDFLVATASDAILSSNDLVWCGRVVHAWDSGLCGVGG
ncbi:hypothetical protein SEA_DEMSCULPINBOYZ_52 [Mycobacterium phage Demsculpinboyz]|uniref:Uncharacterized protein n=1 Tax=Mycobacterium phage Demsculpinboyz TaxID=2041528 RepID=A0A2D1GA94_9CAUD|nr:hypothetical protein I5I02_gp052 [Mycobacterium phage Demsculpinboyz]ATN88647.1 hypothetical protein SEA_DEMSCULPINBOYZ_52 [Mycobacterium phage Demsculpinboyz]